MAKSAYFAAGDAVAPGDLGFVDDAEAGALGVEHADARVLDQPEQVAVAAVDLHLAGCLRGPGGDDVLGLVAFEANHVHADGGQQRADHLQLRDQWRRHRLGRAMRLVAGQQLDAPARAPVGVVRDRDVVRASLRDQPGEAVERAAHRVDQAAVGRARALGGDAVVGAEDQAGAVDQQPVTRHALRRMRALG
jgi:hypothetical protein